MVLVRVLVLALVALVAACGRPVSPGGTSGPAFWEYVVDAPPRGSHVVRVEGTFRNVGTPRLVIDEDAARHVANLEVNDGTGWTSARRVGSAWVVPGCVIACTARYTIDLDALARACDDEVDCASRVGAVTLSPALVWMMHPQPKGDAPVKVHVRVPDPSLFATGLRPSPSGRPFTYEFRSPELDEGSFTAFGPLRRKRVDAAEGHVDIAILGDSFAMTDAEIASWVDSSARCVATLYGRFPVDDATLFVVPVAGADEVVFGKVLSLAGSSVVLLAGDAMKVSDARRDWVLVHEMFHLGFPSFRGEGRWLGEGLATYYEPVLRARIGMIDEHHVWSEFARQMPRGLPRPGASAGLVHRDDLDAVYWGGALFALMSDVQIRERTHGARSLDDVIRASLARGGDATRVWTVADVVRVGSDVTGTDVLRTMYASHAARGEPIDLDGLLASLGVETTPDGIVLHDDAPLAAIRRAITIPQ